MTDDHDLDETVYVHTEDYDDVNQRYKEIHELFANGIVREALLDYYGKQEAYSVKIDGEDITVDAFLDSRYSGPLPNSVLGSLVQDEEKVRDTQYIRKVMEEKSALFVGEGAPQELHPSKVIYNGDIFFVTRKNESDKSYECSLLDYYTYLSTGHSVVSETYNRLLSNQTIDGPIRKRLYSDPLRQDNTTPLILGTCTVTVVNTENGHKILYNKRPDTLVQFPRVYGTLPSGSVEVDGENPKESFNIEYTVYREFCEEVVGDMNHWDISKLKDEDKLDHVLLCTVIPMLSPSLSVGTLLYIKDEELGEEIMDNLDSNWESIEGVRHADLSDSNLPFLNIDKTASDAFVVYCEAINTMKEQYDIGIATDVEI